MKEIIRVNREPQITDVKVRKYSLPLATIVWAILFLVAASLASYFYYQGKYSANLDQGQEKEDLAQELSQYLDLPNDEVPTLATVTDKEKLADQTFFSEVENGDKVLIYSKAGKVILYRPSIKKVVNMTTMNAGVQEPVSVEPVETSGTAVEGE